MLHLSVKIYCNGKKQHCTLLHLQLGGFYLHNSLFLQCALSMSLECFSKLMLALEPGLKLNFLQSTHWICAIKLQYCVFSAIWWLAGGSYSDIAALLGISVPSFYHLVLRTVNGIATNKHPDLNNMKFPQTANKCTEAAFYFGAISTLHAIKNCVVVIDGYLLQILVPSAMEVGICAHTSWDVTKPMEWIYNHNVIPFAGSNLWSLLVPIYGSFWTWCNPQPK